MSSRAAISPARRALALLLTTLGWPGTAPALTEAERVAVSDRPPTAAEVERLERECAVQPEPFDDVELSLERPLGLARLPGTRVLAVFAVIASEEVPDRARISGFPRLPNSGIARREFCDMVRVVAYPRPRPGTPGQVTGLRLRPGLDLAADYPDAAAEARRRGQLLELEAETFVSVSLEEPGEIEALLSSLAATGLIPPAGRYLVVGKRLLAPLAR